jgi:hypothetical protein
VLYLKELWGLTGEKVTVQAGIQIRRQREGLTRQLDRASVAYKGVVFQSANWRQDAMKRLGVGLILACLWAPLGFASANPEDLEFRIQFVRDTAAFHTGELMEVELLYSSEAEKKYHGRWTSSSLMFGSETLQISPTTGVVDFRDFNLGWGGSSLGTEDFLRSKPYTHRLDLSDWYRFQKPGHYSLTVASKCVSRVRTVDEGGGEELLTLESNALEFDILPADASWSAAELAEIERVGDHSDDPQTRYPALHRLAILDAPGSVRKLMQFYFSQGPQGDLSPYIYQGLHYSTQTDLVIELLESSLTDPKRNPRGVGADLLAEFQVRKELGLIPKRPENPGEEEEWKQRLEERNKAYERYFAKANALLLASLERRTGPERTAAIYEAWNNAERQNGQKAGVPEALSRLRANVIAIALELTPGQRVQILYSLWPTLPHGELKPMVLSLAELWSKEDSFSLDEGYKFWCEGWPRECSAAILSDAIHPGTVTSKNAVFLVAEGEHPELDESLGARLRDPEMLLDSWESQRAAAIVLRAGSRKLQPAVDELLDKYTARPRYGCLVEAYLTGYLFRVAPADGAKRLTEETQSEKKDCGSELLRTLHQVRYSEEIIPVALKALDSPNLGTAGTAALFLGQYGPETEEAALWRRLEALREEWRERAGELRAAEPLNPGNKMQGQAAQLEQELASALMTGANWKLTTQEKERLREGCLTEKCKDIAEGKMSFGL